MHISKLGHRFTDASMGEQAKTQPERRREPIRLTGPANMYFTHHTHHDFTVVIDRIFKRNVIVRTLIDDQYIYQTSTNDINYT